MQNTSNSLPAPTKILGWHFSNGTNLRYQDPRQIVLGKTLSIPDDRTPIPCKYGLHCCESALDAFRYAPGFTLWRVELEGDLRSHGNPINKWAGRHRKAIAGGIDVKEAVFKFARDCALDVAHLWEMPAVMREFLETGNPELAREATIANYTATNTAAASYAYYNTASNSYYAAYSAAYAHYATNAFYAAAYSAKALGIDIQIYKEKFEKICLELVK